MKDKRSYRLELVTPEKTVLNEEIIFAVIKSGAGPVGIMPEHAPLLGTVDMGILTYRDLEKTRPPGECRPRLFYGFKRRGEYRGPQRRAGCLKPPLADRFTEKARAFSTGFFYICAVGTPAGFHHHTE